jgi:hypothetical protein
MGDQIGLDIEPEEAAVGVAGEMALAQVLPPDFPLRTLLTFLPDVRLKHRLLAHSAEAMAVAVENGGAEALRAAEAALVPVRDDIKEIGECFAEPCDLANQLHKRMTGLRGDFLGAGEQAVKVVGQRIYAETQRLKRLVDDERRKRQEEADRQARETARKAAEAATAQAAPAPVVEELLRRAETAVAPPVGGLDEPVLGTLWTSAKWKARLVGTLPGGEARPKIAMLSEAQAKSLKQMLQAIVDGRAPLGLIDVDWGMADKLAKANMAVDGLERFDEGSTRAKARR